jgi:CheY-like chemotaxis protein
LFSFNVIFAVSIRAVAAESTAPELLPAPLADSSPAERSLVLLVDDARENRELMKLLLASQPLEIHEAGNGLEGVQLFERNEYRLVLMDIQMPVMDGYSATREIRSIEERLRRGATTIVALTAHAYEDDVRRCREAGCDDHIAKPFKKKRLLQCLAQYLPGVQHG